MKKVLILLSLVLMLVTGCGMKATPTKKVEEFLGKYQSMDSTVLSQLDSVISKDTSMSDDEKKEYRGLMEKQYQNLSYKIKNEEIEDGNATVSVEIEVYDYATSIKKSKEYYQEHIDEFLDDKKDDSTVEDDIDNSKKFIDYKIKQLKNVTARTKYDIKFYLTKNDKDEWVLDDITDIDRQKIHGLYEG